MFRELRKKRQSLPEAETVAILEFCTSGVLAMAGDNGYPYAVPLSYAYEDGKIFFHCAISGHKIDAIEKSDKVSFCVIATDDVQPDTFTTHYRSAIAFGRARVLIDDAEKRHALRLLVEKYSPDYIAEGEMAIEDAWDRTCTVEVRIEHLTGKAASEIVDPEM
jgi:nitroimidazol reductase NimA-like FMN-containing flavoprotein (pyridoxamine 5'-phosphate oxidase superfamily)